MRYIKRILLFLLLLPVHKVSAQVDTARIFTDSSTIENVTLTAFQSLSAWLDVPAAVGTLSLKQLQLVSHSSLLPGMNLVPGVRMEERSPGSYRLSIRGSLLRSPFGVRNVKIYWDDIPLTDAGGNTYLQLADLNQVGSAEIIKGPAASLYGANTGGAVILHPSSIRSNEKNSFEGLLQGGSYGLFNQRAAWKYQDSRFTSNLQQTHSNSDGYRRQSAMRRDAVLWNGALTGKLTRLSFLASYTDLYYETPGGLTLQQMKNGPRQARQATMTLPGAETQQASIRNKTVFTGTSITTQLLPSIENTTTLTVSHTRFTNPFITNYEERKESNIGGRSFFRYRKKFEGHQLQWLAGAEWQQNHSFIDNYRNNKGERDTVLFKDELYARQYFFFTQATLNLLNKWVLQAGVSSNNQKYRYKRLSNPVARDFQNTRQQNLFTPRISILYKMHENISMYGVAARGFSPPSLAEIRPSDGNYYPQLQAETGWNYEAGIKGNLWNNRFAWDISAYHFRLVNAIARRVNTNGAEYFVNAGSTRQQGMEAWVKAFILKNPEQFISSFAISHSASFQPYTFSNYISGTADFSGNRITGVPRTVQVSTLELESRNALYANIVFNQTGTIPLNDANDEWASSNTLVQAKLGWIKKIQKTTFHFFAGADNILNQRYSLGHDINAVGRRYYNPAAGRNFFGGVVVKL